MGEVADSQLLGHHMEAPFEDSYDSTGELSHIDTLQFWLILCAVKCGGHSWSDRDVVMVIDNTTVFHGLNSGRSKNTQIMSWLYDIFWLAVKFNFNISSAYIKSGDNTICDILSHLNEHDTKAHLAGALNLGHMCCSHILQ